MAGKKRQPLSATTKPKSTIDPKSIDAITDAIHKEKEAPEPIVTEPTSITRLSVDLDSDLFSEMKVHCARNKVKIKTYIEMLLRSDLASM